MVQFVGLEAAVLEVFTGAHHRCIVGGLGLLVELGTVLENIETVRKLGV